MTTTSHTQLSHWRMPAWLTVAWLSLGAAAASGLAAAIPLQLESGTNGMTLVLAPIPAAGTLFVFTAPDLETLVREPSVILQTNTPLAGELRLSVPLDGSNAPAAFFSAAHWSNAPVLPVLVDIPAGRFLMGSPPTELGRFGWEGPQTYVTFTSSFKMGKYEITQAEYKALMTNNPSYFSGVTNRPVEQVSWSNAMAYCRLLTESQRQAGCLPGNLTYRLPTEAEWEYACRAGTTNAFHYGPDLRSGMANFDGFYEYDSLLGEVYNPNGVHWWKTVPVGSYAPNAWGLYDLHGSVWEWCLDWWSPGLAGGSVTNPPGPATGTDRVMRGGCWYNDGRFCRSAYRLGNPPATSDNAIGFRVVLVPTQP
jgi:formylglycine-generating enzyme required for sulfatase activity